MSIGVMNVSFSLNIVKRIQISLHIFFSELTIWDIVEFGGY